MESLILLLACCLMFGAFIAIAIPFLVLVAYLVKPLLRRSVSEYNVIADTISPVTKEVLHQKILSIAEGDVPYTLRYHGGVYKLRWDIMNTSYYNMFGKEQKKEIYELHIYLTKNNVARVTETGATRVTFLGVSFIFSFSFARGWSFFKIRYAEGYALTELFPPKVEQVYKFSYNHDTFRASILKLIADNGWHIEPVGFSLKLGI